MHGHLNVKSRLYLTTSTDLHNRHISNVCGETSMLLAEPEPAIRRKRAVANRRLRPGGQWHRLYHSINNNKK